jgi:endoglucanase
MDVCRRSIARLLACGVGIALAFSAAAQGSASPAHASALRFMRGVNVGNYMEYLPNTGGNVSYSAADFSLIRSEGFDHVRIPVAWHLYTGPAPGFVLRTEIFTKLDALVTNALNRGLGAIIDWHHFNAFTGAPTANTNQFYTVWRQIAARYASAAPGLIFELLNEPRDAATTTVLNPIYAEAIRQIRQTNPNRTLMVGPGNFNSIDELTRLSLPVSERNVIVSVHCYDPYYFTHQGAEWALPDTATTGVLYPGPPATPLQPHSSISHSWVLDWFRDYNNKATAINPSSSFAFRNRLVRARNWALSAGRPVHVGEFGCYNKSDAKSRVNFYREIRSTMDEQELGWAMWDWKAGFHYILNGRPDPAGMREAIFPPLALTLSTPGTVQLTAAVGKTIVLEKAVDFPGSSQGWVAVSTQVLAAAKSTLIDGEANTQAAGFYRVKWIK